MIKPLILLIFEIVNSGILEWNKVCLSQLTELETLILRNDIIIDEKLFEDVFGTKFSEVILYLN